jgi:hypothetical protein
LKPKSAVCLRGKSRGVKLMHSDVQSHSRF